jgi:predicted ATPase
MENQADWVEGRALSYGESASYLVARDVLRNMVGIGLEDSSAQAELALRTELQELLPTHVADIYPYLAHLLEIHLDETAAQRIKYLTGEALHRQIFQSVQTYVQAKAGKTPLILVWEDLHWADPSSLSLLEALLPLAQHCALLFILIYRPPVSDSRVDIFQKEVTAKYSQALTAVSLPPLSPAESGELLDNLLGQNALQGKLRDMIITKAEGNPFYLEEVIRSLINSGAIKRSDDGNFWLAAVDVEEITLPDTLQGIIMARIDQLDPSTKRILQIASIVGRAFSYEVLNKVVDKVAGGE